MWSATVLCGELFIFGDGEGIIVSSKSEDSEQHEGCGGEVRRPGLLATP
jgi:hypothetical protein